MSQDNVERLLGRLITDSDFVEACCESLERACIERGLLVSELELSAIRETDIRRFASFAPVLASVLDDRIIRAGSGHKNEGEKNEIN